MAYVRLGGRQIYLGAYGSPESHREYTRVLAEWEAGGRRMAPSRRRCAGSVEDLFAAFWAYAKTYYVKDGRPTSELGQYRQIGRMLMDLYAPVSGRAKWSSDGRMKVCHLRQGVCRRVGSVVPGSGITEELARGEPTQDGNRKLNTDTT